jgi:hypothetical protein
VEIWETLLGDWQGHVIDPLSGRPDSFIWQARSRGTLIAEIRYRVPLSHIEFVDTVCPPDV